MSEPENTICLVCNETFDGDEEEVVTVKNLYWHEECLGYMPKDHLFERVRHEDGHAVMDRLGSEVDMTRLFRNPDAVSKGGEPG